MSALDAQPTRVPMVSKISTKRKAKTTTMKLRIPSLWIWEKSIFMKVGAMEVGVERKPEGITE